MKAEVFYDTDVLAEYLTHSRQQPSALRMLSSRAFGVTSVLQAAELFASVQNSAELSAVESVLYGVHVLGFHFRYAPVFGELHRMTVRGTTMRDCMTAGFCLINTVPLATFRPETFTKFPGLSVLDANSVRMEMSWYDVVHECCQRNPHCAEANEIGRAVPIHGFERPRGNSASVPDVRTVPGTEAPGRNHPRKSAIEDE